MCAKKRCPDCHGYINKCNCDCCCEPKIIILPRRCPECPECPPLPIINPNMPCECSSTFAINQTATIQFFMPTTQNVTGQLSLNGLVCTGCSNLGSTLTYSFIDQELSDGNRSFSFTPLIFIPGSCFSDIPLEREGELYRTQNIQIFGIYSPIEGAQRYAYATVNPWDNNTPGQDDAIIITMNEFPNGPQVFGALIYVPDNATTVTECPQPPTITKEGRS